MYCGEAYTMCLLFCHIYIKKVFGLQLSILLLLYYCIVLDIMVIIFILS